MCCDALDLGVFATPVVHPAVPLGQALIRTSVTPAHERDRLARAIEVFDLLAPRYQVPRVVLGHLPVAHKMDLTYFVVH
jgi:hypothetical protein